MTSSRELVYQTLEFRNTQRVPRDLWLLPWANNNYPEMVDKILSEFAPDIIVCPEFLTVEIKRDDPYEVGTSKDLWGCIFENRQKGIIGEVKAPIVTAEDWEDFDHVHVPVELLELDVDKINHFCKGTDKFVLAGSVPRPFEQLQFIRGTEQLYVDLAMESEGLAAAIQVIHHFYCQLLDAWAKTDVDALFIMDDWGSQNSLLINPDTWVTVFKPLYKDYIDIAHKHRKKIFMHSDGNIRKILPHLIELGLDAINSQLFCMGLENLAEHAGKITFWGEIDRQHLLPYGSKEQVEAAVIHVKKHLWKNGGCIAQCEFSIGSNPQNVYQVFDTWGNINQY